MIFVLSIAVINIRDLIKYVLILCVVAILIISGIIVVKGREKWEDKEKSQDSFSFLHCLEVEMPIMAENNQNEETKDKEVQNLKILDSELAMLYNMDEEIKEDTLEKEVNEIEGEKEIQTEDKKVEIADNLTTQVISENNIEASFTNAQNDIKVKNQSKYDVTGILANPSYELKNKEKVIIYHTHTCESYTASEKYNYQMTGAYRTTDLNYSVSKVRR